VKVNVEYPTVLSPGGGVSEWMRFTPGLKAGILSLVEDSDQHCSGRCDRSRARGMEALGVLAGEARGRLTGRSSPFGNRGPPSSRATHASLFQSARETSVKSATE
jgi:hypothetical protein